MADKRKHMSSKNARAGTNIKVEEGERLLDKVRENVPKMIQSNMDLMRLY